MSSVLKKADKLNLSLSLSIWYQAIIERILKPMLTYELDPLRLYHHLHPFEETTV